MEHVQAPPLLFQCRRLAQQTLDGLPYHRQSDCRDYNQGGIDRESSIGSPNIQAR